MEPGTGARRQRYAGASGSWTILFATIALVLGGASWSAPNEASAWIWLVALAGGFIVAWGVAAAGWPRAAAGFLWVGSAALLIGISPLYGGETGTAVRAMPIVVAFAFETLGPRAGAVAAAVAAVLTVATYAVGLSVPLTPARTPAPLEELVTTLVITAGPALLIVRGMSRNRSALEEAKRIRRERDRVLAERDHELRLRADAEAHLTLAVGEAVAASRAKSDFLATMSHELRTPLNAIIGYAEMLLEEADEATRADLQRIRGAGKHLLALINDVLDLSKVEAGKLQLVDDAVDVGALLAELIQTVQPMVAQNGNELRADLGDDLGVIGTDGTRVRQILLNLLSNAAKFTHRGEVTLAARRLRQDHEEVLRFEVRDTGIGISDEVRARLFRPFMQGDAGTQRRYGGTGLGLALSARIASLLEGSIEVQSAPGVGSTFTFTLPAVSSRCRVRALSEERSARRGDRPAVVCVDDEAGTLLLLDRLLTPAGFHVVPVLDPAQAAAAVAHVQPAALTLDLEMPEVDGWAVIQRLREGGHQVPIVLVTALGRQDHPLAGAVVRWLTKPVDRDILVETVRAVAAGELPIRARSTPSTGWDSQEGSGQVP